YAWPMARRELREGRRFPAEDFGYQLLVGFGAQSPLRPSTRRQTQHNCLLIRTFSPMVTLGNVFSPRLCPLEGTRPRAFERGAFGAEQTNVPLVSIRNTAVSALG